MSWNTNANLVIMLSSLYCYVSSTLREKNAQHDNGAYVYHVTCQMERKLAFIHLLNNNNNNRTHTHTQRVHKTERKRLVSFRSSTNICAHGHVLSGMIWLLQFSRNKCKSAILMHAKFSLSIGKFARFQNSGCIRLATPFLKYGFAALRFT